MPPLLLPEGSLETVKSELQIFDRPEYQVSQLHGDWIEYTPTVSCVGTDTATPIQFNVPAAEGLYTDLANSYLIINLTVSKGDAVIANAAKVGLLNFPLGSLFKDVSLYVNNQKVEGDTQMYAYKAYLYNLLGAGAIAKQYQLLAGGWVTDEAEKFDDEANVGYTKRRLWTLTKQGVVTPKVCNIGGPLFLDIALQKQYLTDSMNLQFKFTRQSHAFALQAFDADADNDQYKVKFHSMHLWLRRVQVAPSVKVGHMTGLGRHNAIWKYTSFKMLTYFYAAGIDTLSIPDATPGVFPKCIFLAMVENDAFNGKFKKNPYNFKHFDVSHMSIMMNGQYAPSTPYTPDFANELYMREYLSLFLATGRYGIHEDDNGISLKDYLHGNAIFPFTFAPDLSLDGFAQPIRMVNIRLDMKFKTKLAQNITIILFCLCDTLFEYTANKLVILDNTQMPS